MQTAKLLKEARENRAAALQVVKDLGEKMEKKSWNEDSDGPALEAAQVDLEARNKEVERLETMLDIEARSAGWTSSTTAPEGVQLNVISQRGDKADDVRKNYRFMDAIRAATGQGELSGLTKEMHQEAIREMRDAGISNYGKGVLVPAFIQETRDMSAGTTTEGGFTVQTDVERLIPFLDPRGIVMRMGATFLNNLQGNIDFPRNDASATATWDTEQATATETSPTFDRVQMSPNRLAAFTDISMQIMRQSTISMENFVRNRLLQARDNALDVAALNGSGGSQPTGITGVSGVTNVSIAASPTWSNIVEFETTIAANDADFGNLGYLTTPQVAGILKTIKRDTAGNGFIWEGPNQGSGTINGYRAAVSTLVPTTGGAHYMFFGNWAKLLIGQWGGLEITTNPYTKLKEATVEIVLNTWHDVAVEQGEAFAYSSSVHPS